VPTSLTEKRCRMISHDRWTYRRKSVTLLATDSIVPVVWTSSLRRTQPYNQFSKYAFFDDERPARCRLQTFTPSQPGVGLGKTYGLVYVGRNIRGLCTAAPGRVSPHSRILQGCLLHLPKTPAMPPCDMWDAVYQAVHLPDLPGATGLHRLACLWCYL
jgi:hypothetical protein